MNGNWSAWCGVVGTNTAAKTVAAWRHVHDIFAAEGATNVKFVWNVNAMSVPDTAANAIEAYWPGDAYVDFVTVDGYNFGNHNAGTSWQTPEQIFGDSYKRVTALTSKPFFIAEIACTSNGGDKAQWISGFFKSIAVEFPRITGVCWFNADKEEDWRVGENDATLAAMRNVFQSSY
jgi:beta-mannanase